MLTGRPGLTRALVLVFVALAVAAAMKGGWLLLRWDEPVQRAVEDARTSGLTSVVRRISFLGSTMVVLGLGAVLALLSWRRCRAVATVVLAVTLGRPLLEFTLKALVGRDRPDLIRLVDGTGKSFPSGHVMAAVALWGIIPLVVTLFTQDRRIWWAAVGTCSALIVAIGASRTYLGVHWISDVVGGLVVSTFILVAAERLLAWQHRRHPCAVAHARHPAAPAPADVSTLTD